MPKIMLLENKKLYKTCLDLCKRVQNLVTNWNIKTIKCNLRKKEVIIDKMKEKKKPLEVLNMKDG